MQIHAGIGRIGAARFSTTAVLAVTIAITSCLSAGAATASGAVAGDEWKANAITLPGKAAMAEWTNPGQAPWAAILAVHGLGFHKETYEKFGRRMAKLGVSTYALDVRGFGVYKDQPKVDFEQTFVDIKEALENIRAAHPGIPVYMMGESMGGAIALQSAARYPQLVDGVISSVPAGNTRYTIPTVFKIAMIGLLKGPNAQFDIGKVVAENATDKPALQEKLLTDPRGRRRLRVKDLFAFRNLMAQNRKAAKKLEKTPTLLVQGYRDKLVHPKNTIKVFNAVKALDKNLVVVGQSSHLVLEEGQFTDYTFDTVASWMDKHAKNSPLVTASEMAKGDQPVEKRIGGLDTPTQ
jgi:acylglycerol lipase